MATRSLGRGARRGGAGVTFSSIDVPFKVIDFPIPQKVVVRMVPDVMRDCRMYWAKACMTAWCRSSITP
jgi:hypothetical protein